jgi:hypothetical protein
MTQMMTCVEVMRALRLSRATVKRMLDRGELLGFRRRGVGGGTVIRISRESVRLLQGESPSNDGDRPSNTTAGQSRL